MAQSPKSPGPKQALTGSAPKLTGSVVIRKGKVAAGRAAKPLA